MDTIFIDGDFNNSYESRVRRSKVKEHMRTVKQVPVEYVECYFIPDVLEFGKIYHSKQYSGSAHLCLCGCGHTVYLPIRDGEWSLSIENDKLTIKPSILQRFECKSHYIITKGKANFV